MNDIEIRYPKNEIAWCSYYRRDGTPAFLVTSRTARDLYYMYEILPDGTCKRIGKSKTPTGLEEIPQYKEVLDESKAAGKTRAGGKHAEQGI